MARAKATTRRVMIPRGMNGLLAWMRDQRGVHGVEDKHDRVRGARVPEQRGERSSSIGLRLLVEAVDERHADDEDGAVAERAVDEREGLVAVAEVLVHHLRRHARGLGEGDGVAEGGED